MSLRADGEVTFFLVQHRYGDEDRWVASALDHLLFADLSYNDHRGTKGDRYRALLDPQRASSPLWQRFGINGFRRRQDVFAVLEALRVERPVMQFRVVRRTICQRTVEVSEPRLLVTKGTR